MKYNAVMTRFDGIKLNLHRLTDQELQHNLDYAEQRAAAALGDIAKFQGEIILRAESSEVQPENMPHLPDLGYLGDVHEIP